MTDPSRQPHGPTMQEILREIAAVFQRVKGYVPARGPVQQHDIYNTVGNIEAAFRHRADELDRATERRGEAGRPPDEHCFKHAYPVVTHDR